MLKLTSLVIYSQKVIYPANYIYVFVKSSSIAAARIQDDIIITGMQKSPHKKYHITCASVK